MIRKWLKGVRLIRRKLLSAAIVDELKRCLKRHGPCMQWTVAQLRDHVSTVVDCCADLLPQEIATTFDEEAETEASADRQRILCGAQGKFHGVC